MRLAIGLLISWLVSWLATGTARAGEERFPALEFETLEHGAIRIAAPPAPYLVVNFWATWCTPCLKEMPELERLDRAREDVVVLGLAYDEAPTEELRDFLARRPVSYPIARVDPFAPPEGLPVPRGLPLTYLLAPERRIVHRFLGPVTAAEIEAKIAAFEEAQR
ncbi:MAG: TlpA disulfide reductase family protein [Xanthomonadales bacterium]|nr:TlpA disulfide reductase family protein [Xanthomonadales bacterium]